jgi:hypothetical protein
VSKRVYPLPEGQHKELFVYGLVFDVAAVLKEHGYPPVRAGDDIVRLQLALFRFLYTEAGS